LIFGPKGRFKHAPTVTEEDFGCPCMIETAAGRLAVYQVGAGSRTLVFWPSLFTDHSMYRRQAAALMSEFRMLFIDGFGHGASGPQAPGASVESHAQALLEVLDQLQIARAGFIGTSWGGLVGSQLARLHPQRLVALIALNTPYETRPGGPGLAERAIVIAARMFGSRGFFASGVAKAFFAARSRQRCPQSIAEFKTGMARLKPRDLASVARTVMWERHNALPWLNEIAVPTTVVAGSEDRNLGAGDLKRAAALIPGAVFIEAPACGHMSAIESSELVTSLIRGIDWHDLA
jgi:3-oxoadipate enol-lactonase